MPRNENPAKTHKLVRIKGRLADAVARGVDTVDLVREIAARLDESKKRLFKILPTVARLVEVTAAATDGAMSARRVKSYADHFRAKGIFETGAAGRGGVNAALVETGHCVYLLLAVMADSEPLRGVEEALKLAEIPCIGGSSMILERGALVASRPIAREECGIGGQMTFGRVLVEIINSMRAGLQAPAGMLPLQQISAGQLGGHPCGAIHFFEHADGRMRECSYNYSDVIEPMRAVFGRSAIMPAKVLEAYAKLLGPLAGSSGGGGPRLDAPADQTEATSADLPANDGLDVTSTDIAALGLGKSSAAETKAR